MQWWQNRVNFNKQREVTALDWRHRCNKGRNNKRPQSPTVTVSWHASEYKVRKLHQRYIIRELEWSSVYRCPGRLANQYLRVLWCRCSAIDCRLNGWVRRRRKRQKLWLNENKKKSWMNEWEYWRRTSLYHRRETMNTHTHKHTHTNTHLATHQITLSLFVAENNSWSLPTA